MRLALYEPDIPQNAGAMLRTAACLGVAVDIIEPCGFVFDDRRMRRAGMDYLDRAEWQRHSSWDAFLQWSANRSGRLILLTTRASQVYTDYNFQSPDILLVGRESAGVPESVHRAVDARVLIPMNAGERSLNVAVSAAMVLGEALRQTARFPGSHQ
ncbi:MAG: tRNA (cytidine(34)-2'-O)-methyltransferase [Rhodospirillales bacterium]